MPMFRKKPVVIEAMQFQGQYNSALFAWAGLPDTALITKATDGVVETTICIPTLEGIMDARQGDWIIKGVAGEIYPCKPAIFTKSYEACGDQSAHPLRGDRVSPPEGWQTIDTAPKDGTKFTSQDRVNYGDREFEGTHWYVHPSVTGWNTDDLDCGDYEFEPTHWKTPAAPSAPAPADHGDVSSLIAARCSALPGKLIDCPVCGAVDKERDRQEEDVVRLVKALDEVKPSCVLGCEGVCGRPYIGEEHCCTTRAALASQCGRNIEVGAASAQSPAGEEA